MIRDLIWGDIENYNFTRCLGQLIKCCDKDQMRRIYYRRHGLGIRTLVSMRDDKIVGTASYFIEPKFSGNYIMHIEDVVVDKDYRKQGIAAGLINEILNEAIINQYYKVILHCSDDLIGFYKKFGFYEWANGMRYDP